MFTGFLQRWRLKKYIKQGLQIADDCRLVSLPNFGSEPYLISIGRHVTIASGVSFIAHDGGTWVFRDQPKYREVIRYGRIVIHDNCFIGYGSIIIPGVSIGPDAVVASGAVVTRDVPPGTVAGGAGTGPHDARGVRGEVPGGHAGVRPGGLPPGQGRRTAAGLPAPMVRGRLP